MVVFNNIILHIILWHGTRTRKKAKKTYTHKRSKKSKRVWEHREKEHGGKKTSQ
jgi:hypothetical protein